MRGGNVRQMKLELMDDCRAIGETHESHMIANTNACFILCFRVFKKASPNGKVSVEGAGPDTPGLILIGSPVAPPPSSPSTWGRETSWIRWIRWSPSVRWLLIKIDSVG